jgi:DNA-directed RNA polymerase specialized sigma24 family protein
MTKLSGVEKLVVDSVSRERLMTDTEMLSQWVRLSGSEEERRAFDYVEDALRGMGLETERHMGRAYVSLPQAALLVVLEALTPAERLAYVLHDMFSVPFDEIGAILERSPEAARQLASRARRRIRRGANCCVAGSAFSSEPPMR